MSNIAVKKGTLELCVYDTAGQEEFENLRILSYSDANVIMACYSTISISTLENLQGRWIPEARTHCASAAIVIIGTKSDLKMSHPDQEVDENFAIKLSQNMKCFGVKETSARFFENEKLGGIKEAFALAVASHLEKTHPKLIPGGCHGCQLF